MQTKTVTNSDTNVRHNFTFTFTVNGAKEILGFGIKSIGGYANNVGVAYFSYAISGNTITWNIAHMNPSRNGAGNDIQIIVEAYYV